MNYKNSEYILYLDMDGVLVDFDAGFHKISRGIDIKRFSKEQGEQAARAKYLAAGVEFWAGLEWVNGGKEIWDTASRLFQNVHILSSAGTTDPERGEMVITGKRHWLSKHIPSMAVENIHIVLGSHRKQEYASPMAILVDDLNKTIQSWQGKGGIGILHDYAKYKKSVKALERLASFKLSEIAKQVVH